MSLRYRKRPRIGDWVSTGRYGDAEVLSVHAHGRVLRVRDTLGQEWPIERAENGVWVVAVPPSSSVDEGNPDR